VSVVYGIIITRSYMPGFFEALRNLPERKPKKYFITVQGKEYEVSLKKKKWAQAEGENNLIVVDGEIVVKPSPAYARYPLLVKSDKGYIFQDNDMHWPNKISEGGVIWQIESE